jgi:hypothetical protein
MPSMATRPRAGARQATVMVTASSKLFVCAECRHAQLFAVQPRALCTREGSPLACRVLFAGQPACPLLVLRSGVTPSIPG